MDDYDWQLYDGERFQDRYPQTLSLVGLDVWRLGATAITQGNSANLAGWPQAVEALAAQTPRRTCPRVFVSHRQTDIEPARRIAYLASRAGFDYWLDVIDLPASKTAQVIALEGTLGRQLTPFEIAVLQAALIELALVNCTHVLAVMTSKTAGSQWVPYEYGRVANRSMSGDSATCWHDTTSVRATELPDYLHLAPVHLVEKDIRKWFADEVALFPTFSGRSTRRWNRQVPKKLPTG